MKDRTRKDRTRKKRTRKDRRTTKGREKRRMSFLLWIAALLFAAGAIFLALPFAEEIRFGFQGQERIGEFREREAKEKQSGDELLEEMKEYNERIFREGQKDLKDAWSYEQAGFDLSGTGLDREMVGYITIPAMDVELPLYIGADEENLSKGAAVLGQTSMPIGGNNTNCVIAAHRGYGGVPMFREIERLMPGDTVEITNLWETLSYRVVKSIVIPPDDIGAVKIIEGEDMVTLVTCHPYTENYQRYVVYCRRAGAGASDREEPDIPYEGVRYESSEAKIRRERMLGVAGSALFLALTAAAAGWCAGWIWKRKKRREGGR